MIGNDILIGANAITLKGVAIGDCSIIGAGGVVSLKEIPRDSLVAGNPACVIRNLAAHKPGGIQDDRVHEWPANLQFTWSRALSKRAG